MGDPLQSLARHGSGSPDPVPKLRIGRFPWRVLVITGFVLVPYSTHEQPLREVLGILALASSFADLVSMILASLTLRNGRLQRLGRDAGDRCPVPARTRRDATTGVARHWMRPWFNDGRGGREGPAWAGRCDVAALRACPFCRRLGGTRLGASRGCRPARGRGVRRFASCRGQVRSQVPGAAPLRSWPARARPFPRPLGCPPGLVGGRISEGRFGPIRRDPRLRTSAAPVRLRALMALNRTAMVRMSLRCRPHACRQPGCHDIHGTHMQAKVRPGRRHEALMPQETT